MFIQTVHSTQNLINLIVIGAHQGISTLLSSGLAVEVCGNFHSPDFDNEQITSCCQEFRMADHLEELLLTLIHLLRKWFGGSQSQLRKVPVRVRSHNSLSLAQIQLIEREMASESMPLWTGGSRHPADSPHSTSGGQLDSSHEIPPQFDL